MTVFQRFGHFGVDMRHKKMFVVAGRSKRGEVYWDEVGPAPDWLIEGIQKQATPGPELLLRIEAERQESLRRRREWNEYIKRQRVIDAARHKRQEEAARLLRNPDYNHLPLPTDMPAAIMRLIEEETEIVEDAFVWG